LPGVKLQVQGADLLDDAGREINYPQAYDLRAILGPVGRAITDREGRFRMDGLPDRACFFISARRPEADDATVNFYAATIDGPNTVHEELPPDAFNGRRRHEVKSGDLAIILPKLRPIAVTVMADDTGQPFPRVRIGTSTPVTEIASSGTTDGAGKTLLNLPPGRYEIYSDPPIETRYIRTEHLLLVVERGHGAQPYVVRQKAGSNCSSKRSRPIRASRWPVLASGRYPIINLSRGERSGRRLSSWKTPGPTRKGSCGPSSLLSRASVTASDSPASARRTGVSAWRRITRRSPPRAR
jgi:hypothetical protein